jgi:hypothetical protein
MTGTDGWLRHASVAARLAGGRPDLWLPGSLGALSYLAWLPLLLTVSALPKASDLAFLGARLLSSGSFPWNVLLLAGLATLGVLLACLLAAFAEAALLRAAGQGTAGRSLTRETEVVFSVLLIAVLPAVAIGAALVSGIAAVAPAEYGAPDIGGPLLLRIVGHLVPLLVALTVLTVVGQAFGAAALRRATGPRAVAVGAALSGGLRDLLAHPLRRLGVAVASMLTDLLALAVAIALLRVLWAPIEAKLAGGQFVSPQALLLLVGFVAIWLALVLGFGALHAWVSAWWSVELGQAGEASRMQAQEANP